MAMEDEQQNREGRTTLCLCKRTEKRVKYAKKREGETAKIASSDTFAKAQIKRENIGPTAGSGPTHPEKPRLDR